MIFRLLGLFFPLRRRVWLKTHAGKVILRRVYRREDDEQILYMARREWRINDIFPTDECILKIYLEDEYHSWYFQDWGEYRPWWNPLPPEQDPRLIEINLRAKRPVDGRFRKTRTLPEVWEQG